MPQKSLRNFHKGMNKDVARTAAQEGTYLDATNFSLAVDDSGESRTSLITPKGNTLQFTIPTIYKSYQIKITSTGSRTLTINGDSVTITVVAGTSIQEFYDGFLTKPGYNVSYRLSYNKEYLTILGIGADPTIVVSAGLTSTQLTSTVTSSIIVGSTVVKNDLILFTAASGGDNELSIWKTTYDESTSTITLTVLSNLIYTKDLNYSLNYTIKAKARPENQFIYRVYFTDDNNPIRSLNILHEQVLGMQPELLELQPDVDLPKPEIDDIVNGSLMSGVREYFIRYLSKKGKISLFSPASNIIPLIKSKDSKGNIVDFNDSLLTSATDPENTNKGIKLKITNVDLSYDYIELVCAYRESLDGAATIELIKREEIYQSGISSSLVNGTVYLIHSGTEITESLTESDILSLGNQISHAKDLEEKEDRIFYANTREETPDLTFDARAYRFRSTVDAAGAQLAVLTGKTNTITLNGAASPAYTSVPINHDAINAYNDENPDTNANWSTDDQFKYQADGLTLGGSGTYIQYKFSTAIITTEGENAYATARSQAPWYDVSLQAASTTLTVGNESINIENEWKSLANPKLTKLRGYCRGEIYRFGIVLYDLKGRPGFVNWIGDIKFPETSESSAYLLGATSGAAYNLNNLGIEFTINFPTALKSQISGYSIVRVERKDIDKTRVMQGMLSQILTSSIRTLSTTEPCAYISHLDAKFGTHDNNPGIFTGITPDAVGASALSTALNSVYNFDSPDLVNKENRDEIDADTIKTNAKMASLINTAAVRYYPTAGVDTQSYRLIKYDNSTLSTTGVSRTIKRAEVVDSGRSISMSKFIRGGEELKFINYSIVNDLTGTLYEVGNGAGGYEYAVGTGCKSALLAITDATNIDYGSLVAETADAQFATGNTHRKIYCSLIKWLSSQYGGNTYEARSLNRYISCSEFKKIDINTTYTHTQTIFGGDIYLSYYDFTKIGRMCLDDVDTSISPVVTVGATDPTYSVHVIYPVESTINPYYRLGTHFANNNDIEKPFKEFSRDNFTYNDVWHQEANLVKFTAKPVDFEDVEDYPNRISYSEAKIDGELIDSWSIVKTNNYQDLEANKGELTGLINFHQDLYFIQQRAFGKLLINPLSLIQDGTNTQLLLGTGDTIQKPNYISTDYGSSHLFSIAKSDNGIYFYDSLKGRIIKYGYGEEGRMGTRQISVIDGLHAYMNNDIDYDWIEFDNPTNRGGVISGFDFKRNEMLFGFHKKGIVIPSGILIHYNEDVNAFSGFYEMTPTMLIPLNKHLLSVRGAARAECYEHNVGNYLEFYGTKVNAKVKFVVNDNPDMTKIFNHLCLHQKATKYGAGEDMKVTFSKVRCYTDHQNSDYKSLVSKPTSNYNTTIVDREVRLAVPRNAVIKTLTNPDIFDAANIDQTQQFKDPMRDKYMVVELWFEPNSDNVELRFDFASIYYDISYR